MNDGGYGDSNQTDTWTKSEERTGHAAIIRSQERLPLPSHGETIRM